MPPIENNESSSTENQGSGNANEGSEGATEKKLTTEQELEKEFGQPISPATDDDEGGDADESSGEDDEGEAEETGEDEGEAEEEGDAKEGQDPDERTRNQKRIDDLTAASRENERRAAAAERDAAQWRRRAEELGAKPEDFDEGALPEEPDPSNTEKYKYGEGDIDYIRDRAKYDAKMEVLAEANEARFKAQSAELEVKWNNNLAEMRKADRYPDFDEKVIAGARDEKWRLSAVIAVGAKDSDYGPDILYDLASNPAEAERIAKLTPLEQAREFGRMEERHHAKRESEKRKAERKAESDRNAVQGRRVSKAPPPPKRNIRGGGGQFQTPPDTDDFGAFDRYADKVLATKTV